MTKKAVSSKTEKINRVTAVIIHTSLNVIVYAVVLVFFCYGVMTAYQFGKNIFSNETMTAEPGIEMQVTIQEGASPFDIGRTLEDMGVIHDAYALVFQTYFYEYTLKPGVYQVDTAMTVKEVLAVLSGSAEEESEEAD